ncbi:MAG: SDR family oxidoreductase [Deltaproteobacteria bacterium]|nr:SDR family oxidoreductase [Deltaproteobacteria bacterium]
MPYSSSGKGCVNAIITGASRGLGRELALGFINKTLLKEATLSSLTLMAREPEGLRALKAELETLNTGTEIFTIAADLSCTAGIDKAMTGLKHRPIVYHVLINNAGSAKSASYEKMQDCDIEEQIYVNLIAPMQLTRFFMERFFEGQDAPLASLGRVIQISSISAFMPHATIIPYAIAKRGLMEFATAIAKTFPAKGFTINTIVPGLMATDMGLKAVRQMMPGSDALSKETIAVKMAPYLPEKKITSFDDVVNLVGFLISKEGGALNGEFFRVASGLL